MATHPAPAAQVRRDELRDTLRRRITDALQAGVLARGDRLPSVREVAEEFDADPRLALRAYQALAREGLVDVRPRSGVYVAVTPAAVAGGAPAAEGWVVDVLTEGVTRNIPADSLGGWLTRCATTVRLRGAVVATSDDQVAGICRELRDDYGIDADGLRADALTGATRFDADVVVTTDAHARRVRRLAELAGRPCVVVSVRPDLVGADWRLLLRAPVYVVVSDERFVPVLRGFFADVPGAEHVRPVVLGRDDVSRIPEDAPVYVTRSARARLGSTPVPGRLVPPARIFSRAAAREVLRIVVRANLAAVERRDEG